MIYYKIKTTRLAKKLSAAFVASELQMSILTYKAIERGEVDLKLSKIFRIAEIFGVFAFELFDNTDLIISDSSTIKVTEGYSSFSDVYVNRYLLQLKAENLRLKGCIF